MPHVILTDKGWEGFTGLFGRHEFHNGRSIENLSSPDAALLAAITPVVTDEGANPSIVQHVVDNRDAEAPVVKPAQSIAKQTDKQKVAEKAAQKVSQLSSITREQLEQVADKQGLKGLREVAAEYGVKANSISDLIEKILNAVEKG